MCGAPLLEREHRLGRYMQKPKPAGMGIVSPDKFFSPPLVLVLARRWRRVVREGRHAAAGLSAASAGEQHTRPAAARTQA